MKKAIVVFSQNLNINSITVIKKYISDCDSVMLLTSHQLFDYEIKKISDLLGKNVNSCAFIDFVTMNELQKCDKEAYYSEKRDVLKYYKEIKRLKNEIIANNLENKYEFDVKIILSEDLGIDKRVWINHGYKYIKGDYYYNDKSNSVKAKIKKYIKNIIFVKKIVTRKQEKCNYENEIYSGNWSGKKYIFIGKMNRVEYRMMIDFQKSDEEAFRYNQGIFEDKDNCIYLTSLHEAYRVRIPDEKQYQVYQIQDGYLPPFYSCSYKFKPKNHSYMAWDQIGERVFKYLDLDVQIMPFRNKIYLPEPIFPKKIKNVLVVTSGAGDWTAMKNRSDEDRMAIAFVEVAKANPDITFIYRCHPVWVHPQHQGVNSIIRIAEYFESTELSNIKLSANIPQVTEHNFTVTYPRTSLEEDLKMVDIVFGDHSVSMIDAAIQGTLFASVNVTHRQNFFESITNLGFPHCESVDDINRILRDTDPQFKEKYKTAIDNYNKMTDLED